MESSVDLKLTGTEMGSAMSLELSEIFGRSMTTSTVLSLSTELIWWLRMMATTGQFQPMKLKECATLQHNRIERK